MGLRRTIFFMSFAIGLMGCSVHARDFLDPRHWPIPLPTNNLWTEINRHWALSSSYETRKEVVDKIRWYQAHPESLRNSIDRASPYLFYVFDQTQKRKMPAEIALLPFVESEYRPFAHSWAGASGIWQLMPGTADGLGLEINWWYDGRRDLVASTDAALNYLDRLHRSLNQDWLLAIAAYDAGEGRVRQALKANNGSAIDLLALHLPGETIHYLRKLLAIKAILDKPDHFGIDIPGVSNQDVLVEVEIDHQIELAEAARLAGISTEAIHLYNPGFRRWATPPNGPHNLLLPIEAADTLRLALTSRPNTAWVKWTRHTIKPGDSLSTIAEQYHTRTKILIQSNHLKNSRIRAGQTLLVPVALKHQPTSLPSRLKPSVITGDRLPGPKATVHIVKAHETLSRIAQRHHVKTSQIIFWNNLSYRPKLKPGMTLRIWHKKPIHPARAVIVKSGDSLSTIAHQYHTSITRLVRLNNLKSNVIRIGRRLILP